MKQNDETLTNAHQGDLTLGARGATITLNDAGNLSPVGFTATSIVGALNELAIWRTAALAVQAALLVLALCAWGTTRDDNARLTLQVERMEAAAARSEATAESRGLSAGWVRGKVDLHSEKIEFLERDVVRLRDKMDRLMESHAAP